MNLPVGPNSGFKRTWTLTAVRGVDTMKNVIDLDVVFKYLRKKAKTECSCDNANFVTEIFHEAGCPYIPISEKAFAEYYAGTFKIEEPKKEISHASEKVTSIIEEPARQETGPADDFKLTPG
jgi:hypothetical protein